jgi:hypothetical protein
MGGGEQVASARARLQLGGGLGGRLGRPLHPSHGRGFRTCSFILDRGIDRPRERIPRAPLIDAPFGVRITHRASAGSHGFRAPSGRGCGDLEGATERDLHRPEGSAGDWFFEPPRCIAARYSWGLACPGQIVPGGKLGGSGAGSRDPNRPPHTRPQATHIPRARRPRDPTSSYPDPSLAAGTERLV